MSSNTSIPWFIPKSLLNRMLLLMLIGIALAQGISSAFWSYRIRMTENKELSKASTSLAMSLVSLVRLINALPPESRHLLLDHGYNMEGSRFYLAFGKGWIALPAAPSSPQNELAMNDITEQLNQRLAAHEHIFTQIIYPPALMESDSFAAWDDLLLLNSDTMPKSSKSTSILLAQIEVYPNDWVYLAARLPTPATLLNEQGLPPYQLLNLLLMSFFLLPFTYLTVRWQIRPLRHLATAAAQLALNIYQPPIDEEGSSELVRTTRAFNAMHEKLKRYIDDREQLFRSISHDLKTPITRLRLRTELLDDDEIMKSFNRDLDELEIMTKGALQTVRDTDIHENIQDINVLELIHLICEGYDRPIEIQGHPRSSYRGKPLAIKRCIGNLVENGIKYGHRLTISIVDYKSCLYLYFTDEGPGIPKERQNEIFEPYVRLDESKTGSGLGLGIARNIAHAHGGDINLLNLPQKGLQVRLQLPHIK